MEEITMKAFRTMGPMGLILLMGSFLLPSAWTAPGQDVDTRSWMVVLPRSMDAQPETYEVGPLEEGESRQFFTNAGDEIVVSREEKGRVVKVNGKTIPTHFDRSVHVFSDDEHHPIHIRRKKIIDGDEEHQHVVQIHEGHDVHVEQEGEEEYFGQVDIEEDSTAAVHMHILKSAPHHGVHINSLSVSEDGPTILFIDRIHVEE
jgi:hypothetical protein